jgi:acetyl esterase/lipase
MTAILSELGIRLSSLRLLEGRIEIMLKANFTSKLKILGNKIRCAYLAEWLPQLMTTTLALAVVIALNDLLAAQSAQSPNEGERVRYHPSPRVQVVSNVIFARYGSRSLRLDLYLPADRKQTVPGAIVIRGGGWMVNDRAEFAHVASALAERGVAAANIEYRTAIEAPFPAALQDVKAAIRWMRANAASTALLPTLSVR